MCGASLFDRVLSRVHLEVNPALCLRLRHQRSSCRLCRENCPSGAISFDGSLQIDNALCHGCGVCANLCPTDAFQLRDLPYESLLAGMAGGSVIEFACSSALPGKGVFRVPCLGYLNEAVLLGGVACGAPAIRLDITPCKKCRFPLGLRVAAKSWKRANRILALFGLPRRVSAVAGKPADSPEPGEGELYSRKEFFSYLKMEMRSRVTAASEEANSPGEMGAKTRVTLEPRLPKKRSLLLEHIPKLGKPVAEGAIGEGLPFARVEIRSSCDGCGMCVVFCPSGALRSYEEEGKQVIDFSSRYCLACGLCSDVCPRSAVVYSATVRPLDLVTDSRKILTVQRKLVCTQCGQSYIALSGSTLCLDCRKKKEIEKWLVRMWQPRAEPSQ